MKQPDTPTTGKASESDRRKERLARQLRENLQRRKAQARSKRAGEADLRPDGLPEGTGKTEPE